MSASDSESRRPVHRAAAWWWKLLLLGMPALLLGLVYILTENVLTLGDTITSALLISLWGFIAVVGAMKLGQWIARIEQ